MGLVQALVEFLVGQPAGRQVLTQRGGGLVAVGAGPVKALFEVLAGPLGQPGVRFGRYRTVALDGCKSVKVPDTPRNRAWLGKLKASLGETGYPVIQLMTLVETGTRGLLGAVSGPTADGEGDFHAPFCGSPGVRFRVPRTKEAVVR